nr:integrase, catalytic region, zinc finger, CCHC-type, peptidase aspartic, catalytic [Tanacetum cinerariifolium]
MGQFEQSVHMLIKPQVFYDYNLKQALGFQNPFFLRKAQQIRPMLYDGNVIAKETNVISIADSKETLMLEEKSQSKMLLKLSDPMVLEKKVNIKPIIYAELQEKYTTIKKLKAHIKRINETSIGESVKKDFDEIKTINIDWNLGKDTVHNVAQMSNATTMAPSMYKIYLIILAPRVKNNKETQEYYLKHTMEQTAILEEVVQIVLWYLDSGCSKHKTGDRSQLTNFVHKFFGTVKFGNDQVAIIMGYGDYHIGNVIISRVYFVEGLGHNLFSVGSQGTNLYSLSIGDMMASSPICLLSKATKTKSWLWHRCLSHLNFGALNHLARNGLVKYLASKDEAPDFIIKFLKMIQVKLNAAVKNIRTDNGTKKPDLSYLHVFGALCYPNNDSEHLVKLQSKADIGIFIGYAPKKKAYRIYNRRTRKIIETIHVDFDELTAMASKQSSLEPTLHEMTPTTLSSGLVPNLPSSVLFVPPSKHEWDLVFQPVFDEFFSPPASVASPVPIEEAPALVKSTGLPHSQHSQQDAPSLSTSHTTPKSQSPTIPLNVEEESHDLKVAHMSNDLYFGIPIPETVSAKSSSTDVIHAHVHFDTPNSKHSRKWTKYHPL